MPTANPRISVTLTPSVAAVLDELSQLSGNSRSAIVGDLLEMSQPVFERVITVLRAAQTVQASAKAEISASLEQAQARIEGQMGLLLGELDAVTVPMLEHAERVNRRAPKAAGAQQESPTPLSNRGVTPRQGRSKKA